jgi:hypothetical protein
VVVRRRTGWAADFFCAQGLRLEASVTRENIVSDNLLEKRELGQINNYFLLARYKPAAKHELEAFYLVFDDRSGNAEDPCSWAYRAMAV